MSGPSERTQALITAVRNDPYSFLAKSFSTLNPGETFEGNWHIEAMIHQLNRIYLGENRRLLITIPPRHLKSFTASVAYPAWWLGQQPSTRFMVASYGADLATGLARNFRSLLDTGWYRAAFPRASSRLRDTVQEIETADHGGRKSVSLGGAVTGFGANVLIVDDLMKAQGSNSATERKRAKDFYELTLRTRSNDKRNDCIIVIQQRLHEDDLAGFLLDKGGYFHLNLPAIAEEEETFQIGPGRTYRRMKGEVLSPREPLETLEEVRRDMGETVFSAQYQQNPLPPGGGLIQWDKIQTYDEAPERAQLLQVVQSWDTAYGVEPQHDYSVCTTWGYHDECWLLLEVDRVKLSFMALTALARELRDRWLPDKILVENASTGLVLWQELHNDFLKTTRRREAFPKGRVFACTPVGDKAGRFAGEAAKLMDGRVRLPAQAPWLAALKQEILAFGEDRCRDDQVDSISQFLIYTRGEKMQLGRRPARDRSIFS